MNDHLIAVAIGAVGIVAISAPYLEARSAEDERKRHARHLEAVRAEAVRLIADAVTNRQVADLALIPEVVEAAWQRQSALPRGRGAGGLGPRYAELVFRRSAAEYLVTHLLRHGALPVGEHMVRGEWIGVVRFPHGPSGEA